MISFPTADQIAIAIVESCKLAGGNPILIAMGQGMGDTALGRHVALASLVEAFPDARKAGLARCCGYRTPAPAVGNLKSFRQQRWWNEDHVDEVVGAVIGEADDDAVDESTGLAVAVAEDKFRPTPDERKTISRLWTRGADAVTIAAAIGCSSDEIASYALSHPDICPPRKGSA